MNTWSSLSNDISSAVEQSAPSIVQVHGRRRVAAGIVFAENLIITPARVDDDKVAVHRGNGHLALSEVRERADRVEGAVEGVVLGRVGHMGLTVIRVEGLGLRPLTAGADPKPGDLAVAIGRTWSGNVMAMLAPISVVGGPLRTGRRNEIERVIRIQQPPHGALTGGALIDASGRVIGVITSFAIRGTTVVIPASLAFAAASKGASEGGEKQGFLGVASVPVAIPERQRAGRAQGYGLLVSQISDDSPADAAGLLVGDVIVGFDGHPVEDGEELVTRLRGDRVGKPVPLTIIRGTSTVDVTVTVGERPIR